MEEIKLEGAIYPSEGEASFMEKIDKQGRIQVPRVVRDKLGVQMEAIVAVKIKVLEVYEEAPEMEHEIEQ